MKQPIGYNNVSQNATATIGVPINPVNSEWSAQCAFTQAIFWYYAKAFFIFGASAAAVYGTVFAGSKAAADNYSVPYRIGIPSCDQYGNPNYSAVAYCTDLLLGYVDSGFASASALPTNHSNPIYTMMMSAFKFACAGISNITLGESTFSAPQGNVCNDVSRASGPDDNGGILHAMFGLLAQLTGNPTLNLDCKNASGFGGYVTLALFMAIAAAALSVAGVLYLRITDKPQRDNFFNDDTQRRLIAQQPNQRTEYTA